MKAWGVSSLTREELLMVMLGRGVKGASVGYISSEIEKLLIKSESLGLEDLVAINGMGEAKAFQILACMEFSSRLYSNVPFTIEKPEDVWPLVVSYTQEKQEHLVCITLNGANEVITQRVITIGLLNQTQIHPREVFVDAIVDRAAAIILVHNHPSGVLEPSDEDLKMTHLIHLASKIIGIKLLDHLIISEKGYYSFSENLTLSSE